MTENAPLTEKPTDHWFLRIAGYGLAILTGLTVFVLIFAAGYRGRGVVAISFLIGAGVLTVWRRIASGWLSAALSLILIVALAGGGYALFLQRMDSVLEQIEDLGENHVIVRSVRPNANLEAYASRPFGFTRADIERLEQIPTVDLVSAFREMDTNVTYPSNLSAPPKATKLIGCTSYYQSNNHLEVDRGRFLTPVDLKSKTNVCVLSGQWRPSCFHFKIRSAN